MIIKRQPQQGMALAERGAGRIRRRGDIKLRCILRHGEQLASTSDIGGTVFAVSEQSVVTDAMQVSIGVQKLHAERAISRVAPPSIRRSRRPEKCIAGGDKRWSRFPEQNGG
jgi:hypothetical protein